METDRVVVSVGGRENPASLADVATSPRKYADVSIAVDDVNVVENISGVCDCDAEQCVIRADLVAKYFPTVVGQLCYVHFMKILLSVM